MIKINFLPILLFIFFPFCKKENKIDSSNQTTIEYIMPVESKTHEGTWLQWPHQYQYGIEYRNSLDSTWIEMTKSLVEGENVHIIAYNQTEKDRITALLNNANIPLSNIDFKIYKTDDVWVRDNGPIYVWDKDSNLVIQDWGFNAWGKKTDPFSGYDIQYSNCNSIPAKIGKDQGIKVIDLNSTMIVEGGALEIDGNGTMLLTKSAILNKNRNPGMTQSKAEEIFTKYYGVTHFIWLEGAAGLELTDMHIDGFAKFVNENTILTLSQNDLLEWGLPQTDIDKLYSAVNKNNVAYTIIQIPLTKNNVVTTKCENLGYKGSYANFYIANKVVLVPNYNDPNDEIANQKIQTFFPNRTVVGIDVRNLYQNGGMVHCVTQQQPAK